MTNRKISDTMIIMEERHSKLIEAFSEMYYGQFEEEDMTRVPYPDNFDSLPDDEKLMWMEDVISRGLNGAFGEMCTILNEASPDLSIPLDSFDYSGMYQAKNLAHMLNIDAETLIVNSNTYTDIRNTVNVCNVNSVYIPNIVISDQIDDNKIILTSGNVFDFEFEHIQTTSAMLYQYEYTYNENRPFVVVTGA